MTLPHLTPSIFFPQFQLPDGSLVIEGVEAEDAGEYTCRVANVAGMVYHTVNLIVRS